MTLDVTRVDWLDPRAVAMRTAMDAESGARYTSIVRGMSRPDVEAMQLAFEVHPGHIAATILVLDGDEPVGHAALRPSALPGALEVKKVFVPVPHRGRGISRLLMSALEQIAAERGIRELVLQTGTLQVEAIALYEQIGYERIPAFGGYGVVPFAVCYRKAF